VILVSGPTELPAPEGADWIPVRTAHEMRRAVLEHSAGATAVIMAAAVADYRPTAASAAKIQRSGERLVLELEPTPDILRELSLNKGKLILIGFAAETDHLAENARAKLARKGVDMIVANDVTQEGAGFDADTNVVTFFLRDGREIALPKLNKMEVAQRILDHSLLLQQNR
jgi:phosphopantothenoylcysteine decarboxylase / phosphopantothenate---cysteine ligase